MDINTLINKYIDGELSPEEDARLRKNLAESPELKVQFDAAVETQYLIAKDAESVIVPTELYQKSEEAVLARIMGKAAAADAIEEERRRKVVPFYLRWAGYSAAAGIALFALIFGVGNFQNSENENKIDISENVISIQEYPEIIEPINIRPVAIESLMTPKPLYEGSRNTAAGNNIDNNDNNSGSTVEANGFSANGAALGSDDNQGVPRAEETANSEFEIETIENTDLTEKSESGTNDNQNSEQLNDEENQIVYPEYENSTPFSSQSLEGPISNKTDIIKTKSIEQSYRNAVEEQNWIFSSNLTTDISGANSMTNEETISNFSVSLGYKAFDNHIFGAEFGNSSILLNQFERRTILSNPNDPTSTPITINVPVTYNLSQLWATGFYEYKLNLIEDLDFRPRVGIGMGQAGAMGFARAMFTYDLFNGIGLRAGAEYRGMGYTLDGIVSPVSFYSSTSFIYGLDYSF